MGDTIFALSSGHPPSGVAIVRLSGPQAQAALTAMGVSPLPPPRVLRRCRLVRPGDPADMLDRALAVWMPGPASFTGEDCAELHLHGGPAVVSAVLDALSEIGGLRLARPGEFSRRAFDNGKMDLSAAEGLADLIAAETDAQRQQALNQLGGGLARQCAAWQATLKHALAHMEAAIDFSDEDLPDTLDADARALIDGVRLAIERCLDDGRMGERVRHGLSVVILGPPNAGKSSLLNALAGRDAAITAAEAGTTRDVVQVRMRIGAYPVTLFDTAGLRDTADRVEQEGVRRARAAAADADIRIVLLDGGNLAATDSGLAALLDGSGSATGTGSGGATGDASDNGTDTGTGNNDNQDAGNDDSTATTIAVLNKTDLMPGPPPYVWHGHTLLALSVKNRTGLDGLIGRLEAVIARRWGRRESVLITRARHREALQDCRDNLRRSRTATGSELWAEDLRQALRSLGRVTGQVDVEDLLDVIFSDFCIGK